LAAEDPLVFIVEPRLKATVQCVIAILHRETAPEKPFSEFLASFIEDAKKIGYMEFAISDREVCGLTEGEIRDLERAGHLRVIDRNVRIEFPRPPVIERVRERRRRRREAVREAREEIREARRERRRRIREALPPGVPPPPPPKLSVTITARPTSGEIALRVLFRAEASGGTPPYTFEWLVDPERPPIRARAVIHTYRRPGRYMVRVTVTDTAGVKASAETEIIVYPKPVTVPPITPPTPGVRFDFVRDERLRIFVIEVMSIRWEKAGRPGTFGDFLKAEEEAALRLGKLTVMRDELLEAMRRVIDRERWREIRDRAEKEFRAELEALPPPEREALERRRDERLRELYTEILEGMVNFEFNRFRILKLMIEVDGYIDIATIRPGRLPMLIIPSRVGESIRNWLLMQGEGSAYGFYKALKEVKKAWKDEKEVAYTSYGTIRKYFTYLKRLGLITISRVLPKPIGYGEVTYRVVEGREVAPEWTRIQVALYPATVWGARRYPKAKERGQVVYGRRPEYR